MDVKICFHYFFKVQLLRAVKDNEIFVLRNFGLFTIDEHQLQLIVFLNKNGSNIKRSTKNMGLKKIGKKTKYRGSKFISDFRQ